MSDTTPITAAPSPSAGPAAASRASRLVQATAVVALAGVIVALGGLVVVTRPLRTPTQDCGTAFSFLVSGRVNEFVDPANPPPGTTRAEARANLADPCQERAANRARPAGVAVVGGTLLAVLALLAEWAVRARCTRVWRRAAVSAADDPLDGPPATPTTSAVR